MKLSGKILGFPLSFWILLAAAGAVFLKVWTMGYVQWDDDAMIQENMLLRLPFIPALKAAFSGFYHGDYLPLTLLSYWLDIHLFGFTPSVQHIENWALHLFNVVLLFTFLSRANFSVTLALPITIVFALHPVQVESVAWMSERKGLLATAFLLMACLASQLEARERNRPIWFWNPWNWAYLTAFLFAFFFKAVGIFLPLFLILLDRLENRKPLRPLLLKHLPVLLIAGLAAWLRVEAYRSSIPNLGSVVFAPERWIQLPAEVLAMIGFNLRLFFWPGDLSIIYPTYQGVREWIGFIILAGVAIAVCVAVMLSRLRRGNREGVATLALHACWCGVFLLPVLQIIPRINFVNDRYLYLPMVGMTGLFLSLILNRESPKTGRRLRAVGVAVIIVLAWLTFWRIEIWRSNLALWGDTVKKIPLNAIAHNNYGMALRADQKLPEAETEFKNAALLGAEDGTSVLAYNNLGILYTSRQNVDRNDLTQATAFFRMGIKAAQRVEDSYVPRLNLAQAFQQAGNLQDAATEFLTLRNQLQTSSNQRYQFLIGKVNEALKTLERKTPK